MYGTLPDPWVRGATLDTYRTPALPLPRNIASLLSSLPAALNCGTMTLQLRKNQTGKSYWYIVRGQHLVPCLHHPLFTVVLFLVLYGALFSSLGSFLLLPSPPAHCTSPGCVSRSPQWPVWPWSVCIYLGPSSKERWTSCLSLMAALTPEQSFRRKCRVC